MWAKGPMILVFIISLRKFFGRRSDNPEGLKTK